MGQKSDTWFLGISIILDEQHRPIIRGGTRISRHVIFSIDPASGERVGNFQHLGSLKELIETARFLKAAGKLKAYTFEPPDSIDQDDRGTHRPRKYEQLSAQEALKAVASLGPPLRARAVGAVVTEIFFVGRSHHVDKSGSPTGTMRFIAFPIRYEGKNRVRDGGWTESDTLDGIVSHCRILKAQGRRFRVDFERPTGLDGPNHGMAQSRKYEALDMSEFNYFQRIVAVPITVP